MPEKISRSVSTIIWKTVNFTIFHSTIPVSYTHLDVYKRQSSLSAEFISMVPKELKEGAYSLGGTRLDVIRRVIFPVAGSGIFASYILALGRALGETMAVTMLIGNTNILPTSFTSTGNTMASVIANQFGEADGLKLSSLIAIGLLLFLITAIINFIGKMIMKKLS